MIKDQIKAIEDMMSGVNASLKHAMHKLPPEEQAKMNQFTQEIMGYIPDVGEFLKADGISAQEMQKKIDESRENIINANEKMIKNYADNNNR